jgi:Ca2+-binding RTX toxin-like protein
VEGLVVGAIFGLPNSTGVVFDDVRDRFYVSTSDGDLYAFDPTSHTLSKTLHLGGTLAGLDISPASDFLVVADSSGTVFGSGAYPQDHHVALHRVALTDWTSTDINFDVFGYELGPADVAITNQHTALLTTQFSGSGWTPLREFDPAASGFNSTPVQGLGTVPSSVSSASYLISSPDHHYVLVLEGNISNGAFHIFDAVQNKITASQDLYGLGTSGFNNGKADITNSGLIVNVTYNNIFVTDVNLQIVRDLSQLTSAGRIVGAHFNDTGDQLFLWDSTSDTILVYDTHSWLKVSTLTVGSNVDFGYNGAPWGLMAIGNHGGSLFLQTRTGFEIVDVPLNRVSGSGPDELHGAGASDTLAGGGGGDSLYGAGGDDSISGGAAFNYLRGDDGNDSISGGTGFDDINGNAGADTAHGNDGDDWVVGGKDNDLLFGDNGFDIVYGNLGDDTVSGGDGADWVRGGQGDDSVSGGAGDDLIWGDRGNDTVSGGAGADIFHSFTGAGLDRVIDFSLAEGDRVQLDPGSVYTIKQVGSDAVIDLGGGDQVVLVGVQASTLGANTVFVG